MNLLSAERADAVGQLNLVLAALDAGEGYEFVAPSGLSAVSIYIPNREAIVGLTSAPAPLFRAGVEATAVAYVADVVLLRTVEVDGTPVVTADVALAAPPCAAWVEHDLTLWTGGDEVWLVPELFGPAVEVTSKGFKVALVPPYDSLADRAVGIARAARDVARRLQPVEA